MSPSSAVVSFIAILRDGVSDAAPQAAAVLGVAFDPGLSELIGLGPRSGV